jgi:hypothetical protein
MKKLKEIRELDPNIRKRVILQLLDDLNKRRQVLESEIKQLCTLWDDTVDELNGRNTGDRQQVSNPMKAGLSKISGQRL